MRADGEFGRLLATVDWAGLPLATAFGRWQLREIPLSHGEAPRILCCCSAPPVAFSCWFVDTENRLPLMLNLQEQMQRSKTNCGGLYCVGLWCFILFCFAKVKGPSVVNVMPFIQNLSPPAMCEYLIGVDFTWELVLSCL